MNKGYVASSTHYKGPATVLKRVFSSPLRKKSRFRLGVQCQHSENTNVLETCEF